MYLASMFVTVAMSGRVDVESHVRDPIINCILRIKASCVWGSMGLGVVGGISLIMCSNVELGGGVLLGVV